MKLLMAIIVTMVLLGGTALAGDTACDPKISDCAQLGGTD